MVQFSVVGCLFCYLFVTQIIMFCFCSPYDLHVDEFAELWADYEHECKTTITVGRMDISCIADNIVHKRHMAVIQLTGMHRFLLSACRVCVPK